jgi:uncharacterized membrane protein YhaH (DUF805 family)
MSDGSPAGWYHAEGDPQNTIRYWNGSSWTGTAVVGPPLNPSVKRPIAAAQGGHGYDVRTVPASMAGPWRRAFSMYGRINRQTAIPLMLFLNPIAGVILFIGFVFAAVLAPGSTDDWETLPAAGIALSYLPLAVWFAAVVALIWLNVATTGKRLHDIGMSGWFVLLAFIPVVAAAVAIMCFVVPGQPVANRHGMPPPPGFRV